jgi:hypothetical protein
MVTHSTSNLPVSGLSGEETGPRILFIYIRMCLEIASIWQFGLYNLDVWLGRVESPV